MDFNVTLEKLIGLFKEHNIKYALIGGFALGIWGVNRVTLDLDFLVLKDDLEKLNKIMIELGYECRFQSEDVSQYISPLKIFGEIDFLHAFRKLSWAMLEKAEEKKVFNKSLNIKVLKKEDLIGLKIQAMTNDPTRKKIDLSDIEALLALQDTKLDWKLMEDYFTLFELSELFNKLKEKYFYNAQ